MIKRTAFLAAVAVVLLAMLAASPATARSVYNGDTIYVGEESLDLSPVFNAPPVVLSGEGDLPDQPGCETTASYETLSVSSGTLVYYSSISTPSSGTVGQTIAVADVSKFELTASAVGTATGTWYAFTDGTPLFDPSRAAGVVFIEIPATGLDVLLNGTTTSVNGRSVSRSNDIQFRIVHNVGPLPDAAMEIRVTTPGGGTLTVFEGVDLRGVGLAGSQQNITAPIPLQNAGAGTYTAQAVWPAVSDFYGKGFDTNTVAFEVITSQLFLSTNKETVIRGNSFTVTVAGEPNRDYRLSVRDVAGLDPGEYPVIAPGQVGVTTITPAEASLTTTAAGTRSVQFNTNQSTHNRAFSICVEDLADATLYDEVTVWVEKGSVTVMASGIGAYTIGEEIVFSGTNTESDTTYLFLTGPNLDGNGVRLEETSVKVRTGDGSTFTRATVAPDDTWSYRWNTADLDRILDAGIFTIYAASQPCARGDLGDARYSTASFLLQSPTLTAEASGPTLVPGDEYRIGGTATGAPGSVQVWIIGPDCRILGVPVRVDADGTFEYVLEGTETGKFVQSSPYYVVVQHPLTRNEFEVFANDTGFLFAPGMGPVDITNPPVSDAVNTLLGAFDPRYVDDIYTKSMFSVVKESWIWIDRIDDQAHGEPFIITGGTSYPAGTALAYQITAEEGGVRILSGEVVVTDGGEWSFDLATVLEPGSYSVRVVSPDGLVSETMPFNVCDNIIHPVTPAGATYRIESIRMSPPLGELSPGGSLALAAVIDTPWAEHLAGLEFSTDLEDPYWSYDIELDRVTVYTGSRYSRSFGLSAFELDYGQDVRLRISLDGIVPEGKAESPVLLGLLERNAKGEVVPKSGYCLLFTPGVDGPCLTLSPGWNFISIPRPLAAGNDTAAIFAGVDTDRHSALRYDTASGTWIPLQETDRIAPLEGIWIYSAGPATVPLTLSTELPLPPSERTLVAGWNAVGITGTTPPAARDALLSVDGQWTTLIGFDAGTQVFETAIVNDGSGEYADNRSVYPGRGYWLYMTGPGTLCAIGA
ncbi:DUF3821 domain-containing protein [Methanoculleus sp. YWC-01]|uniref:DUF3821 domain-containing protein n=1 Tax=Methanoculleus nereidis TaxID=2735141 RepID=A0ABU3Z0E6_9EURY|nr:MULTISPECIES: DUF3821 domain-containing protein [unclassified Methanoculleus]MCK9298631.1 DUF3821 domain-containing protein [Methanoculleus sp.]MDD3933512.1 DUF3821 domain-containing protein [Methanoculleus sp.]MDV4342275.1 DUF3821 domain-containing protein [Methanoculleus sp. YWC-01]